MTPVTTSETNTLTYVATLDPKSADAALKAIKPVASVRSAVQALTGVLIDANNGVFFTCTDMESTVRKRVPRSLDVEPFSEVAPFVDFQRAVKALAKCAAIELLAEHEADGRIANIVLKGGRRTISLRPLRRDDFPSVPSLLPERTCIAAPAADFAEIVARALPFASRDQTRPILTGIAFETTDKGCAIVSTDSYRLAVLVPDFAIDMNRATEGDRALVNIPGDALKNILRGCKTGAIEVRADWHLKFAHILLPDAGEEWVVRTIDGSFPSFAQLIPDSFDSTVDMPRQALIDACELAVQFAQKNAPMRLSVNGTVKVTGYTPDTCSFEEIIADCEVCGQAASDGAGWSDAPFEIGFNPEFARDIAKTIRRDRVTLRLITPLRPALFEDGADKFLLMPIRLNV